MSNALTLRAALLCCGASFLAMPVAAFAQDTAGASSAETGEILVTATRREQRLQDVAMSVDVATGEDIEKLKIFDTKDIQQLSPGLELSNTTGRNNTTSLRGISFDPDQGTGPAVRVYLNEIPTDAQTVYTAMYDIGQIEVLRGPQGLLRGLSSPAGSITITTRRPTFDKIEGQVQATATDANGYNVQGGITMPFNDKLAIRAAFLVDGNDLNRVRNVNRNNDKSRSRTQSGRLTLGWKPTEDFTAYLSYQYLHSNNTQYRQVFGAGNAPTFVPFFDPTLSGPPATVDDRIAVSEGPNTYENKSHIINLQFDWDLGGATLSFAGAHQNSRLIQNIDLDPGNAVPNWTNNQTDFVPYKVDTAELRLSSNGDGAFGWGIGAFYTKQTGDVRVTQNADSFFGPYPTAFGLYLPIDVSILIPVFSETFSASANARYKMGDFTLEGGLRYSVIKSVQSGVIRAVSPGYPGNVGFGIDPIPAFDAPGNAVPPALQRETSKPITGGLTLTWEPSRDLTVYASYGHSFRQGSAGVGVPQGISNDLIRSGDEKTDSYEIGLKGAFLDRRLNVTLAAFYQSYEGFLGRFTGIYYNCREVFGSCNAAGPAINNATDVPQTNGSFDFNYNGDATAKGVEFSLDGRPTDNWDISVNMSYVQARFDNALVPCNDFNGDGRPDAAGTPRITGTGNVSFCQTNGRLADLPEFSLAGTSEIRFPMGDLTPYVRGLVNYRPGLTSDTASYTYQSRTVVNMYVGLRGPESRWELTVFAKNLLDQQRITNISQGNARIGTFAAPYDSGYRLINSMTPREFGATLAFRF